MLLHTVDADLPESARRVGSTRQEITSGASMLASWRLNARKEFKGVAKFNKPSMPALLFVVGQIGADRIRINDIRWAAHMPATMFIATSHTIKVIKQTRDKRGLPKPVTLKVWRNFAPVIEAGAGKGYKYGVPVKVAQLPNGNARATEYDGKQFELNSSGVFRPLVKGTMPGLKSTSPPMSSVYDSDDGDEHLYYGRGLVQLTWWYNYAAAGVALGRALEFVFESELVNDRTVAHSIMSTGMLNGTVFANGHKFSTHFNATKTDYVKARDMVNAGQTKAEREEIASYAERFERILFASKPGR